MTRDAFGSRAGFVLAAVGSAVGLGNMWRFPYRTAAGGGAAFVLLYLGMTFLIGVPMMMAEFGAGTPACRRWAPSARSAADGGCRSATSSFSRPS